MSADRFFDAKGQFIAVEYVSTSTKPASAHKHLTLSKRVRGVFRAGIDYANLSSVREGIEAGERGEVESLPWGVWDRFPYTITHRGATYFRLYPVEGSRPTVTYMIDGQPVTREAWMAVLTPSDRAKMEQGDRPACITVRADSCSFPDAG